MSFVQAEVIKTGNNSYQVSHGDDNQLFPEFYDREVLDKAASEAAGRPIHKTVPYCRITFPGDKTKVKDEPVDLVGTPGGKPPHPQRFPRQWAAYSAQMEQVPEGTSLLEWPPLPRAEARDLKAMKIHTVEQLAALPDTSLTWLGAQEWRNKAKVWLERASGGSGVLALQKENEVLKGDVEMLKQQIKDLAALKSPDEAVKRGPGRPKSNQEEF